jgi:hypothetical protein
MRQDAASVESRCRTLPLSEHSSTSLRTTARRAVSGHEDYTGFARFNEGDGLDRNWNDNQLDKFDMGIGDRLP